MINLHFDPITTELVLGKKKKDSGAGVGTSATVSALIVPAFLELQVNNLTVMDYLELTETGAFTVFSQSAVEVR